MRDHLKWSPSANNKMSWVWWCEEQSSTAESVEGVEAVSFNFRIRKLFFGEFGILTMATKWGIMSTGRISQDFVSAMLSLPHHHRLVAVGARELANAKDFASKFGAESAYGSYEELVEDSEVGECEIWLLEPRTEPLTAFFFIFQTWSTLDQSDLSISLLPRCPSWRGSMSCARSPCVWTRSKLRLSSTLPELRNGSWWR